MMGDYALVENGVVVDAILWDGEGNLDITQVGYSKDVALIEIPQGTTATIGYLFKDGKFSAPPLTEDQQADLEAQKRLLNVSQKDALLSDANQRISVLQDAVELNMATEDEISDLPLWKKYRVLLSRVEANTADDITWPQTP